MQMISRFTEGARLADTERRTWKNKTNKVPMGNAPLVSFKVLYRHERRFSLPRVQSVILMILTEVLRKLGIVDPRLTVLPTAEAVSAMAAGLLQMANSSGPASSPSNAVARHTGGASNETAPMPVNMRTGNPYSITVRNGCRIYKLITLNPEKPGPQSNNAKGFSHVKQQKRKKKTKSRRSETVDDDLGSEANYEPSEDSDEDNSETQSQKKAKNNDLERMRKEVAKMQAQLEEAERVEAREKGKTQKMDVSITMH